MKLFLISLFFVTSFFSFRKDSATVTRILKGEEIKGKLHPKGGGFVALTAFVEPKSGW